MPNRIFLSHARGDENIAQWLLRQVNAFQTPPSLVGTTGSQGSVPARIKLATGLRADSEDEQAEDASALNESQALIVLCSPSTAADPWVNREVDAFVALGRLRRILPVIAPDAPDTEDVERDFFPPAVCGRGLFTIDLRETRRGALLVGDGREGGLMKLLAALLGVEVHRVAHHVQRRQSARIVGLALAAAIFAGSTVAAGAYGLAAQRRAMTVEAQRQVAARNAMEAAQLRNEAIAAGEAEAARRAQANAELQQARGTLVEAAQHISAVADLVLNGIAASRSATPENVQTLSAIEQAYWKLGEISPYFELRPASISPIIEKITSTYVQIGRAEDGARATARFERLNRRIARNLNASPVWRNAYAASIVTLAGQRAANGDSAGQIGALEQASQIFERVCIDDTQHRSASGNASSVTDARINACIRFANVTMARASAQNEAGQPADPAPLERARVLIEAAIAAYPNNARIQSAGPPIRDQLTRVAARNQSVVRPPSGQTPAATNN